MQFLLFATVCALALTAVLGSRISEDDCRLQCHAHFTNAKARAACYKGCSLPTRGIECGNIGKGCVTVAPSEQDICYAYCLLAEDYCYDNPCENNGVCQSGDEGFTCTCPPGYSGAVCEEFNPCVLNTCHNSGTCVPSASGDSYTCQCAAGFAGIHCDDAVLPCDLFPCLNGGTCANDATAKGFTCTCPTGIAGPICDVDTVDECSTGTPCVVANTVNCTNGFGKAICLCKPGFVGADCGIVNPCVPSPCAGVNSTCEVIYTAGPATPAAKCNCQNGLGGSTCQFDNPCSFSNSSLLCLKGSVCEFNTAGPSGNFFCNCSSAPGWSGQRCSVDLNECNDPLLCNPLHGTCVNKPGSYECQCDAGYTGRACESDINECIADETPCQNGGVCTNTFGGYECQCEADFEGDNCETQIDDCPSEKYCKHGGVCIDGVEDFSCQCAAGWTGPDCSRKTSRWVKWGNDGCSYIDVPAPRLSYAEAAESCALAAGSLVSIRSSLENEFVSSLAKQFNKHPRWIGAQRTGDGLADFSWDDGNSFNYRNFFRGEPNNEYDNEDCLSQGHSELGNGQWNDADCSTERRFVCKKCPASTTRSTRSTRN